MKIDYWYDKYTKSWIVQRKDENGDQIGNSDYVASKKEAQNLVNYYKNLNKLNSEN